MEEIRKRIAALSTAQRELLAPRLRERGIHLDRLEPAGADARAAQPAAGARRPLEFSLFFFSGDGDSGQNKYDLLVESARFADRNGFQAVWTPERHFQRFGGLYPNPALLAAALALVTRRISLRAGSVVLPLHSPLRVAEEWAVVDNLSGGRVAISVATGWHPGDFLIAPQAYANRRELAFDNLRMVCDLWEGKPVSLPDVNSTPTAVAILPRPIQPKLPIWVTASGSPQTWVKAGELGANILCALISQTSQDLSERIQAYRRARQEHGHDPNAGTVSLMLHTFIGDGLDEVRARVRQPMRDYLDSFVGQYDHLNPIKGMGQTLREDDRAALIDFACERYMATSALLGTVESCAPLLDDVAARGVNEIACMIDFGLPAADVLAGLERLDDLRRLYVPSGGPSARTIAPR